MKLQNFAENEWVPGIKDGRCLRSAIDGTTIATIDSTGINFQGMLNYARRVGGPNLRKYTFHERALMLKKLAQFLMKGKMRTQSVYFNKLYHILCHTATTTSKKHNI